MCGWRCYGSPPVSAQLVAPHVGEPLDARLPRHQLALPQLAGRRVVRLRLVQQVQLLQQPLVLLVVSLPQPAQRLAPRRDPANKVRR